MNGVLTLITTALSSGLVAAGFSSAFVEGKERWELRRRKIEEIYKGEREFEDHLTAYASIMESFLSYQCDADVYFQFFNSMKKHDYSHLGMNVDLYEPSLEVHHLGMMALNARLASLIDTYNARTISEQERHAKAEELTRIRSEFKPHFAVFRRAILARGREIAGEPGQVVRLFRVGRSRVSVWRRSVRGSLPGLRNGKGQS